MLTRAAFAKNLQGLRESERVVRKRNQGFGRVARCMPVQVENPGFSKLSTLYFTGKITRTAR